MKINGICVKVDCGCPYLPDYPYYPKHIEGLHCVADDDPRAKVGAYWAEGIEYCVGIITGECKEGHCEPRGKIVEVIMGCDVCPFK